MTIKTAFTLNAYEQAHMQAIAEANFKRDSKVYSFITEANKQDYIDSDFVHMVNVLEALCSGNMYLGVQSVAKSGMSRIIKIAYIKDNKLHNVNDFIYRLAGCDKNHRISGCGMDMLFAAQYNLFKSLTDKRYQDHMKSYNNL